MKYVKKTISVFLSILTILSMCSVSMPVFAAYDWKKDLQQIDDYYLQEEFSSKIVAEVEALREENTKHFLCEDGSYIATTYSEPIHYKENGEWKEIDNTLKLSNKVKSSSGKAMYVPKSADTEVKIPQSFSDGQKISLTKKGHTISFGVSQDKSVKLSKTATVVNNIEELSSNVQPDKVELHNKTLIASTDSENYGEITKYNNEVVAIENQAGAIVYEDVFESADLEYVVTTNSIKENIVVYEKQNDYTYKFDMDFGDLVPIVNEDNSIRVVDPETEETVFFVGAPYMYDANDIESTDIDMSLVKEDRMYLLTLKASSDWINASERTFPVVIDPIVYLSFDDVFVMDGLINKNLTKVNKELRVGRNLTNLTRTYIKPTMPSNIPEGSYVNSACLYLYRDSYYRAPSGEHISINAYSCNGVAEWNTDTITWNNQPFDNSENGYKNNTALLCDSEYVGDTKYDYWFDITFLAEIWINTGINKGIMLASSDESTKTQMDFYSSRATDSSFRPEVSISYVEPSVDISSWETDSQAKESAEFRVSTSYDWSAYSDVDWISFNKRYLGDRGFLKIIVDENEKTSARNGTVTVKMDDKVIGTIAVTQYGADPHITVDTTTLNFDVVGGTKTVNIESNTVWSFNNLPDWITVTPTSGSKNSTVEIKLTKNTGTSDRQFDIIVTADSVTKTIKVTQLCDNKCPEKPDVYEENGLVFISSRSFNYNDKTDNTEHIEYKIGDEDWAIYDGPFTVVRTCDTIVYARVCDEAGNISEVTSFALENTLGEYTADYTDIALGEGLFPVGFGRSYTSTKGWFFTFEANVQPFLNGFVFTNFYGKKQYFIKNGEDKYLSVDDEELTVNADSYVLTYGDMTCTFGLDGKINRITTDYLDTQYTWSDNSLTITGGATVTLTNGKPTKITITRTDGEGVAHTKEVEYIWTDGNLTKFIDAADVEHNYVYTDGLLTTNETETITYSAQGRVKLILQPNGAFVKYTYNDNATNAETPNNVGAVTVSDSKGVTDTIYYADGVYIKSYMDGYGENALYAPDRISEDLTDDVICDVIYVPQMSPFNTTEGKNTIECTYDNNGNILTKTYLKMLDNTVITTDKYVYTYTEKNKIYSEKYYKIDKSNELRLIYEYIYDSDGNIINETYYAQKLQNGTNVDIVIENYCREYDSTVIVSEIYKKRIGEELTNQKRTLYSYNDENYITEKFVYQWINDSWYQTYGEEYVYNDCGNITSQTITVYTNFVNAETGLIKSISDSNTIKYEYDVWGQQIKVTNNAGTDDEIISETSYDVYGRTSFVITDGNKTVYTYDNRDNILTIAEGENITTYNYSDNGNLLSRTNPNGTVASYFYDSYGNLTNHDFNGYAFTYNTLGSILTANSESVQLVNYTYSSTIEQDVLNANFGNGQSVVYDYNENCEIISIKSGEERKYGYEYFEEKDANGKVTKEWTELTDYVSELKKVIDECKLTVNDLNGNFVYSVESVSKDEEVEDSFNGTVTTIGSDIYTLVTEENKDTFKTNETTDFTKEYTYVNDELSKTNIAGITTTYGYNAEKLIFVLDNTINDVSLAYDYNYDEKGNLITENLTISSKAENGVIVETNEVINYTYDDKEQLISAETSSIKYEYTYDDRGNILAKKEYSINLDENNEKVYTLIEANTDTYVYDETWEDKLTSYNGQAIIYDAVGNPMNYLGNTLTWTMGRQLVSFGNTSFTYNEDGVRTSKTSNGITTKFYLDGINIIEQTDGTTALYFFYDSKGEVIGFKYNENDYFYVKNAMGDIIAITDSNKNIVAEYRYDPWGKVLDEDDLTAIGNLNPFRYRSYYYDTETEFYYLQSRYYDPEVCRFINSDDVNYLGITEREISYNTFGYCNNNPIMYDDRNGTMALTAAAATLGVSTSTLVVAAIMVIIIADLATGGKVVLTLSEAIILIVESAITSVSSSIASSRTKTLSNTKAKLPTEKAYQLAYINNKDELIKLPTKYSFVDALKMLGFSSATNTLNQTFKYDKGSSSDAQRTMEKYSKDWGIYTHEQSHAKALASVCGAWEDPEVHGSGRYGHYHDATHTFHIWYGGVLTY